MNSARSNSISEAAVPKRKEPKVAAAFQRSSYNHRLEAPSKKQLALSAARALRINRDFVKQQLDETANNSDCRDDDFSAGESTLISDGSYDDEETDRDEASSCFDEDYRSDDDSYDDASTYVSYDRSGGISRAASCGHQTDSYVSQEEEEEEEESDEKNSVLEHGEAAIVETLDSHSSSNNTVQTEDKASSLDDDNGFQENVSTDEEEPKEAADTTTDDAFENLGNEINEKAKEHLSTLGPIPEATGTKNSVTAESIALVPNLLPDIKYDFAADDCNDGPFDQKIDIRDDHGDYISPQHNLGDKYDEFPAKFESRMTNPSEKLRTIIDIGLDESSCTRRMNSYGALKTLASSEENAVPLAWTRGVLKTLAHALNDPKSSEGEINRSVSALLLLSNHSQNWQLMLVAPGLISGLIKSCLHPVPQISRRSCLCILNMSKEKRNRVSLSNNNSLLEALTTLIRTSASSECEKPAVIKLNLDTVHSVALTAANAILTLSKTEEVSYTLARNPVVASAFVDVSGSLPEQVDIICQVAMANLTRSPENALQLVYHVKKFVTVLVQAACSTTALRRKYACFALQNLSCESGCRQELGYEPKLLQVLLMCSRSAGYREEQESALTALDNLSKEPSNLINFTNNGIIAGLLAHAKDHSKPELVYLACDTLATLAHWIKESTVQGLAQLPKDGEKTLRPLPTREQVLYQTFK